MKILIASTSVGECTGYARVSWHLVNGLAARGWDVVHYAFQRVVPRAGRAYDERVQVIDVGAVAKDPMSFGEQLFPEFVKSIDPDVVLIYNDCVVINAFLHHMRAAGVVPRKLVMYLDMVHDNQVSQLIEPILQAADLVLVFAPHWQTVLETRYGYASSRVLPHGLDDGFYSVDQRLAREKLGLPVDGFLVVNTNRNSYRKALDVTIRIFLKVFSKIAEKDMYLFLNSNAANRDGHDFKSIVVHECQRLRLDPTSVLERHILTFPESGFVSDETMNLLYNASDVGVNTCVGEGFGLCNAEAALLKKPQLVTKTGGLADLFGDTAICPVARLGLCRSFVPHGGDMDVPNASEFAHRLFVLYTTWKVRGPEALSTNPPFDPGNYKWSSILDDLNTSLRHVHRNRTK